MTDAADTAPAVDPDVSASRKATRKKWLRRLVVVLAIVGLCWGAWYYLVARNHVSTDNAYVNAQMAQVTPLVAGSAIEVLVEDTQQVKAGDVLVRLDQANAKIAVAQAEADLAAARRRFSQTVATNSALSAQVDSSSAGLVQAQARLRTAQAELDKARIDLQRREAVAASGAVSGEELTQARRSFATASAALDAARGGISEVGSVRRVAQGQLAANDALVRGSSVETDPAVRAAKARLDAALLDLERTEIRAPVSGVVSRLQVQIGQRLNPGQTIMTIVPLEKLYVDANFKEGQLGRVRVDMPVKLTSDLYGGDVVYRGKVVGLAGGTGSSMAVIPAQNATGNWIKTVQRLPVRIELDPADLRQHPLRVGLSMEVEIDVSGN
ncbi:EmrA/EmrK family multidrug efflux transporter periplasmic adaptor subunit [Sphingorhabdus sp.]|jgi:membrane fusion protein (multidrug efflux system)|uniref:EmrA/EmrK family multidrug efflux transporter periplasmic adaptor subunit n=1 Tax=Sphingorhabdus sp. TaxID=1902408 RepID=UPI00261C9AA1|nr:EmrA/EmrK family multidrug efflux transporter periplasmic adaptor subunit [Sphingorhabdus sp.]HMS19812.1 EmrA/EmrK family multidrug efflux transporter periplasmic adaptor subunit [Sphingorhabdus sp.]HMT40294.1 EmrA/EmrK family multidrug efflux transporter periplasmic adaptor subunit [Sphingorhabdus sp.]